MLIYLSIFSYFLYNKFNNYTTFKNLNKKIESLYPYQFIQVGPLLLEAPERKFMQKYMSREEYHDWIDDDMKLYS